jgi:hypothetical protein
MNCSILASTFRPRRLQVRRVVTIRPSVRKLELRIKIIVATRVGAAGGTRGNVGAEPDGTGRGRIDRPGCLVL